VSARLFASLRIVRIRQCQEKIAQLALLSAKHSVAQVEAQHQRLANMQASLSANIGPVHSTQFGGAQELGARLGSAHAQIADTLAAAQRQLETQLIHSLSAKSDAKRAQNMADKAALDDDVAAQRALAALPPKKRARK
jgi:hypothetical protein